MCDPEGNPCDRCKLNDEPDIDSYIEEMEELTKKAERERFEKIINGKVILSNFQKEELKKELEKEK